jgi:hypothetical protein
MQWIQPGERGHNDEADSISPAFGKVIPPVSPGNENVSRRISPC